jgi:hypothetical protein
MTFHACSSLVPILVKPQPAPAILSQESVHTTLSITYQSSHQKATIHRSSNHTWSWISPLMSALTTHTHSNLREKKEKRNEQKKLKQAIESQRKAKSKITWRRQVSDPLGKGNDSTHLRQNYAEAKNANHQTKARKPQRAPPAYMQAPPEPMQLP